MYKCNRCGEEFIFPEKVKPDSGPMYYPGDVTRYNIPLISVCPECRCMNMAEISNVHEITPYIVP